MTCAAILDLFASSPSSGTSVVTLFDVSPQLPASAKGPMRRSSAAQGDALVHLRILCSVFLKGSRTCCTALWLGFAGVSGLLRSAMSLTRMSLDRRFLLVRFCTKESYPYTAKDWHELFVSLHCRSPSWWRCRSQGVTTDRKQVQMWALGRQPVSIASETDLCSFRMCRTGVLISNVRTKAWPWRPCRWLRLRNCYGLAYTNVLSRSAPRVLPRMQFE